jgi:acetyltransferase-like isoleucine patch superfamily enzyme
MKALKEISIITLGKFILLELLMLLYKLLVFPPLRTIFLRLCGAQIGKNCIIHNVSFFNQYRKGFAGLEIKDNCFIGNECLFDLANRVIMEENVTLAERVIVLTHMNVGYKDHPLQKNFPALTKETKIREGAFIGAGSIILAGITIGKNSFVAAGSVVTRPVPEKTVVGGNPAKVLRKL